MWPMNRYIPSERHRFDDMTGAPTIGVGQLYTLRT